MPAPKKPAIKHAVPHAHPKPVPKSTKPVPHAHPKPIPKSRKKPPHANPTHKVKKPPTPAPTPKNFITFRSAGITSVVVLLGTTPIAIASGYGGWTVTSRNRRVGLTTWAGRDPLRMTIPILFDGFANGVSQEIPISRLSRMAIESASSPEPPVIQISGAGVPVPTGPVQWVIESLTWGSNVIWDITPKGVMARMRQDCTVNLLQYVQGDRIAFKNLKIGASINAKPTASSVAPKGWQPTVIAKQGDTLKKIAARVYRPSTPTDWKLLKKANNIRDPNKLKKGQRIRVPKK